MQIFIMGNYPSMVDCVLQKVNPNRINDAIINIINSTAAIETASGAMRIDEVSTFLGVNIQTVYRLIKQGKIPSILDHGRKKVPKEELLSRLESGELIIRGSIYDKWHYQNGINNGK